MFLTIFSLGAPELFWNSSDFSLKNVDWSYHKEIFTFLSGELFKVLKCLNLTNKVKLDLIKTYSLYLLNRSFSITTTILNKSPHLHNKAKQWRILVVVVKWRHRPNGLFTTKGKLVTLTKKDFLPDKQHCLCFPSCTLHQRIQSG